MRVAALHSRLPAGERKEVHEQFLNLEKIQQINLSEVKEMNDYTTLQGELACAGGSCEIF